MDKYKFVEFKSTGSRFNLVITLGKAERFYLGSSFCTKYDIFSMVGVKLFYDKTNNAVGFRFVKEAEEGMVGIKSLDDKSAYINAKAFLGINDIDPQKYIGRYHPVEVTDDGGRKVFVVELKEADKKTV